MSPVPDQFRRQDAEDALRWKLLRAYMAKVVSIRSDGCAVVTTFETQTAASEFTRQILQDARK